MLNLNCIESSRALPHPWDAGELNTWEHPSSPLADYDPVCHSVKLDGFSCVSEEREPEFSASEFNNKKLSFTSQN